MAKSLDELIEFLLEEIALGGETGVTFHELATLVSRFYQPIQLVPADSAHRGDLNNSTPSSSLVTVDRLFLSRVWTWLARHSDVSIGKNNQYNNKSLEDVEKRYPGYTELNQPKDDAQATAERLADTDDQQSATTNGLHQPQPTAVTRDGPRLYVSEDRMSIAICGHPPDPTRVFPSEWVLLLCIAATRNDGILQGDLVRLSGQDKRSVPKRTDALHDKGYIAKKFIYLKGNKTSRLYLRRYVELDQSNPGAGASFAGPPTAQHVARQLFDVLKNNPLIPQEDLGGVLGMISTGRARVLSQLLRHFGRIGCLKRVKTAFGPSARIKDLKTCIQYLKEPTDEDWQNNGTEDIDLSQAIDTLASFYETEAEKASFDNGEELNIVEPGEHIDENIAENTFAEASRFVVPQWNPDRILTNVLFEATKAASSNGMTNARARNVITGPFIKRTLESLLVKVSNRALQAQPPHLRHLAILRAQEHHIGVAQYLHYTFDTFTTKIVNGQAKWSDVSGGQQFQADLVRSGSDIRNVLNTVEVDHLGFATRAKPVAQVANGAVTTSRLLLDAKVKNIPSRPGEPSLRKLGSNQVGISFQKSRTHGQQQKAHDSAGLGSQENDGDGLESEVINLESSVTPQKLSKPSYRKPKHVDENGQVILGRPRKFLRGTERYWRDIFSFIIQERDPEYLKARGKVGLMNDPIATKVFQKRPAGFDQTVVEALEHNLPVPAEPHYISQDWIDKIRAIMNRSQPGLYISPLGYQPGSRRKKAQALIFRSKRLLELDWSDRRKCWPWQQFSSSASHSLRYQRFYARLGATPRHVVDLLRLPKEATTKKHRKDSVVAGPPRGVFYEDVQSFTDQPNTRVDSQSQQTKQTQTPLDVNELTDATQSDLDVPNQTDDVVDIRSPAGKATDVAGERNVQSVNNRNVSPTSDVVHIASRRTSRSMRKRKPTQKVAENIEAQDIELHGGELRSSDDVRHNVRGKTQGANASDDIMTQSQRSKPTALSMSLSCELPPTEDAGHGTSENELQDLTVQSNWPTTARKQPSDIDEDQQVAASHDTADYNAQNDFDRQLQEQANSVSMIDPSCNIAASYQSDPQSTIRQANNEQDTSNTALSGVDVAEPPNSGSGSSSLRQETATLHNEIMQGSSIPMASDSLKRKRTDNDNVLPTSGPEPVLNSPVSKRTKTSIAGTDTAFEISRAQVSKLCRIMVLELIGLCSGLAPNVPWTLRRAMVPRWQEAGVKADQLNAKNVRAAIKALCENGKLKQITFTARGKSGIMVKMSVVALRSMDATSPAVINLQKKMIDMEPADYIPPELEAESQRIPNDLNKKKYTKEIRPEGAENSTERVPTTPTASRTRQKKDVVTPLVFSTVHAVEQPTEPSSTMPAISTPSSPSPLPPSSGSLLNAGFLTLKVSRLGELRLPTEYQYKYRLPVEPLRFNTEPAWTQSQVAAPTPIVVRPAAPRQKRNVRFATRTRKLIWTKPRKTKLPSCLEDVPHIQLSRDEAILAATDDSRSAKFEAEVECVAAWEEKNLDLLSGPQAGSITFINHTFDEARLNEYQAPASIEFGVLVRFGPETEDSIEESFPATESWLPFAIVLNRREAVPESPHSEVVDRPRRKSRKRKADDENDLTDDDDDFTVSTAKRRRQTGKKQRPRRSLRSATNNDHEGVTSVPFLRRNRLTQLLRYMTEEEKYEVVVAVVIVRTLAGGIEKFIDWQTVCRLLPKQEEPNLKEAWRTMAARYRSDVADLTESLQYRYLDALHSNQVPSVNFDNTHDTDWEGIFVWALANLDKSIVKKTEDLPASRNQLLRRNDYIFNEFRGMRDMLGYNVVQTIPRKEEALSGTIFGKPLPHTTSSINVLGFKTPAIEEELETDLSRAKSWVLATLLTPENSVNVTKIQAKLLTLASSSQHVESLLEKAIKSLQRDKLISRSNKVMGIGAGSVGGRTDHLRQYEPSAKFFEQFDYRRMVTATMLKRAVTYKLEILDTAFSQDNPSITIAKDTILADGDMVAVFNLFAMGMLQIRSGADVPASRWGLEWQKHGYTTRMVDKKALGFSVVISPIKSTYVFGDPLADERKAPPASIPRGEIDQADHMGKIPLWFDILHNFQPGLWELVLGAVLGLVSTRPGIDAQEIARTLWFGVSIQEVESVLDWAAKLELVKKTQSGGGWESCEWWWLGVGVGGGWRV